MQCLVALSPGQDLDIIDFIEAWNADPASRDLARADVTSAGTQTFGPTRGAMILSGAGSIALGRPQQLPHRVDQDWPGRAQPRGSRARPSHPDSPP